MGTIRWRGHISPLVICHVVTSWTGKPPCLKTLVNPQKYVVSSLVAEPDGFQCFTCFIQVIEFFHDPFLTNTRCPLETLRSPWFTLWLFNIDMVATVHLWIVHRHIHIEFGHFPVRYGIFTVVLPVLFMVLLIKLGGFCSFSLRPKDSGTWLALLTVDDLTYSLYYGKSTIPTTHILLYFVILYICIDICNIYIYVCMYISICSCLIIYIYMHIYIYL